MGNINFLEMINNLSRLVINCLVNDDDILQPPASKRLFFPVKTL